MFILQNLGKIALFLVSVGILTVVLFPNIFGFVVGPMFVLMALLLFTIRGAGLAPKDQQDTHPDRVYGPITRIMLGVGIGVMAALLIVLVPEELFLPVMIVVMLAAILYTLNEFRGKI